MATGRERSRYYRTSHVYAIHEVQRNKTCILNATLASLNALVAIDRFRVLTRRRRFLL
jgi:hypothetical protein